MSKEKMTIPIFFAVDDDYIPFFVVAVQSLIENSSKKNNYEIKVLYTRISDENQRRIFNQKNIYDLNSIIDINYDIAVASFFDFEDNSI